MARPSELQAGERGLIVTIVAAAALLRLWLNDVASFSAADESIYTQLSTPLAVDGYFSAYAAIAREWLAHPGWWVYPNPLRCGYLALTTLAVAISDSADTHALAWLSTLAGIAVVPLLFVVARRLFDTRTALVAAAFVAVSPLELAMGRRALQDEVFCAAALLAFAAVIALLDEETPSAARTLLAIGALTFALSVKETFLILFPALALFVFMRVAPRRITVRHMALFAAPPLLWWAALTALTRDPTMLFRTAGRVASAMSSRYVVQYQAGPPQRLLFDFLIVAPLVTLLASAAVVAVMSGARRDRNARALVAFLVAALAAFSILTSKNLRFVVMLDPFLCLLAAWIVVNPRDGVEARTSAIAGVVAANIAISLEIFRTIFVSGNVYDPVTHTLLAAVGAIPRDAASAPDPMLWPWICAAIAAVVWLWRQPWLAPLFILAPPRRNAHE